MDIGGVAGGPGSVDCREPQSEPDAYLVQSFQYLAETIREIFAFQPSQVGEVVLPSYVDKVVVHSDTARAEGIKHLDAVQNHLLGDVISWILGIHVAVGDTAGIVNRDPFLPASAVVPQVFVETLQRVPSLSYAEYRFSAHQRLSRRKHLSGKMEQPDALAQPLIHAGRMLDSAEGFVVYEDGVTLSAIGRRAVEREILYVDVHQNARRIAEILNLDLLSDSGFAPPDLVVMDDADLLRLVFGPNCEPCPVPISAGCPILGSVFWGLRDNWNSIVGPIVD